MKKTISSRINVAVTAGLVGIAVTVSALTVNQLATVNYTLALLLGGTVAFGLLVLETTAYRNIQLALRDKQS